MFGKVLFLLSFVSDKQEYTMPASGLPKGYPKDNPSEVPTGPDYCMITIKKLINLTIMIPWALLYVVLK